MNNAEKPDFENLAKEIHQYFDFNKVHKAELAEDLWEGMSTSAYRNYAVTAKDLDDEHFAIVANDAVESFLSAVSADNWYWLVNPIEFDDNETDINKRHKMRVDWEKAEFRTFKNPYIFIKE